MGYVKKIYIWNDKSSDWETRQLIFRAREISSGEREYRYALSNARDKKYGTEELVAMQSQRYFIDRSFHDVKQETGMSDYQVRGWLAWHHHMVLVMMAHHFMLSEKILYKEQYPLMSAYDIREIIIRTYAEKGTNTDEVIDQMKVRHRQRALKSSTRAPS